MRLCRDGASRRSDLLCDILDQLVDDAGAAARAAFQGAVGCRESWTPTTRDLAVARSPKAAFLRVTRWRRLLGQRPVPTASGRSCWRKSKTGCPLSHGRAGRLESILSLPRRGRTQRSSPARYATTWIFAFVAGQTACFLKLFSTTPAPPNRYPRMHGAASSQEMARCFKAICSTRGSFNGGIACREERSPMTTARGFPITR